MKPKFPHLRSLVLAGSTLLSISYAHAADGTWDTDSAGNWTDITNWLGEADYASGADSTATLGNFITLDRTITLDTAITIGNITASDTTHNYTISGPSILTLDRTLGTPTIDVITGRTLTIGSVVAGNDGLIKSGAGTLLLNTNNTFTGDVVVNAGTLALEGTNSFGDITINDAALNLGPSAISVGAGKLGAAGGNLIFTGTSSINPMRDSAVVYNKNVSISGTTTFNWSTQFYHNSFSGVLSGAGTIVKNDSNGILTFANAANTFTGAIRLDGGTGGLVVNSLLDSANAITFNGNTGALALGAGTASSLLFDTRQIVLAHTNGGEIANNNGSPSNTVTINTDLGFTGAGTRTLELSGSNGGANAFNGDITNNAGSAVGVTKAGGGTWALSGTNTYTGKTFNNSANGTLIFQDVEQSLPSASALTTAITNNQNQTTRLLSDTSGTISLGNTIRADGGGTSGTGTMTIFVGNNGVANGGNGVGGVANSKIVMGTLDFRSSAEGGLVDQRMAVRFGVTGANGYQLEVGDVILQGQGTGSAAGAYLNPTSAPLLITGTVKQNNGRLATNTAANQNLTLEGTATGNLISGAIKNSTDFDDLTNANALATNLIKSNIGTWTLSGTNTYTGTTAISNGLLRFTGNSSAATGNLTVSGGNLGGNGGSIGGAVTVSSTGGINLADGSVGNLTLGSTLAITGAAGANNLRFDLGNTTGTSDSLIAAGATTVTNAGAAVIVPNQLGGAAGRTATTYTLIGGAGALDAANFAKFSLATTAAFGQTYALTNTGDDLQLVATNVTGATPAAFWKGGTNNWSDAANWNTDAASNIAAGAAPDYQTNVTFSTTAPAPANLTTNVLDVDFDINSLTLTNASGNVTIGGTRMLTIEAAAVNGNAAGNGIDSQKTSGTNTISAKVGLASSQTWTVATNGTLAVSGAISDFGAGYALTKAGGGNLSLTGATTYTGGTAITGGTLTVNGTSLGAINNGPLALSGGGRLTVSGANIASASQVSVGTGGGLISVSGNNNFTTSGKLTGSGTLTLVDPGGGGGKTFNFNSLENDFTGGIIMSGAAGLALNINSLANSANSIAFTAASGSVALAYGSGAIEPLNLSTRAIELNSAGALTATIQNNNTSQAISIGTNLVATGAGAKILGLGAVAGPSNVFSGTITNATDAGSGTIGVTKTGVGAWAIINTANTFSGTIAVNDGTLAFASAGGSNGISFTNTTGSATLSYTGAAKEMTGAINASTVTSGTVNLVASGSGAINYSNTASLGSTGTLVKNLVLSGTNTEDNILAGAWVNNGTGAATVTKSGTGTWVLSSINNTYTGATAVNAGKLLINGSTSTSSAFNVASGATLGGTGAIGGTVAVANGATLSPGATIESLATGAVTMASGSSFAYGATGSGATGADLLAVNGSLSLTNVTLDLALAGAALSGGSWNNGDKLTLISYIDAGSGITSGFTGYADDTVYTFGSNLWTFDYNDTTAGGNYGTDAVAAGQNRFVTMTVTIPEPSSVALLGTLGAMLLLRRRRTRSGSVGQMKPRD